MNDRNLLFDRLANTFITFCYSLAPDIKLQALTVCMTSSYISSYDYSSYSLMTVNYCLSMLCQLLGLEYTIAFNGWTLSLQSFPGPLSELREGEGVGQEVGERRGSAFFCSC